MSQYLYKDVARLAKDVVNLRGALSDVRRLYHPALRTCLDLLKREETGTTNSHNNALAGTT